MEIPKFIALLTILALIVTACAGARNRKASRRSKRNHATCRPRLLMRYKMTVTTTWTKRTFPKMFPTYRPHPHWSTLMGRSHGPDYSMWQEGYNASHAVRKFAEEEDAEFLEMETGQGYNNVLDIFTAPAVDKSVGQTSAVFMVDGRHSKVSFMMKIIPSPDWFIGLSSLELCNRGRWKKRAHINLRPYDAGTDRGLTFTAPNWPNEPQEPIFAITSSSPNHPASSFFYPKYDQLPRMAYVDIDLVSEHRLRRTFIDVKDTVTTTTTTTTRKPITFEEGVDPSLAIQDMKYNRKARRQVTGSPAAEDLDLELNGGASQGGGVSLKSDDFFSQGVGSSSKEEEIRAKQAPRTSRVTSGYASGQNTAADHANKVSKETPRMRAFDLKDRRKAKGRSSKKASTTESMKQISQQSLNTPQFVEVSTQFKSRDELYVDCLVSEWAEWGPCTKTCGFGTRQRSREVIQMPANGGNNCPLLTEESMCGSMRTCKWSHFSVMGNKVGSNSRGPRGRRRRRRRKF